MVSQMYPMSLLKALFEYRYSTREECPVKMKAEIRVDTSLSQKC